MNLNAEIHGGDDVEWVNDALREGSDKALLKLMRDETKLLVLIVRLENQERREEWEAHQAELKMEEEDSLQPGFGLPMDEEEE